MFFMLTKLDFLQLAQQLFPLKSFIHINKQVIFAVEILKLYDYETETRK